MSRLTVIFVATIVCFITISLAFSVSAATMSSTYLEFLPFENEFASAIVMIPKTHQVLYAFKPDAVRVPASLTKLAAALVWTRRGPLPYNKILTLRAQDEVGGGRLKLSVGAKMSFRDAWFASISASANNAAMLLARSYGGTMSSFLNKMNQVVASVGAVHTKFYDAAGMSAKNVTTARDMAFIADAAFRQPDIRLAAITGQYCFERKYAGKQKIIRNTNRLLVQDADVWVSGGKTGYLVESQYNLAVRMRPLVNGVTDPRQDVVVVVLGAPTKDGSFNAAKHLAQWAWDNYRF